MSNIKTNDACVSVIVPIYNVERYLRQCLESIKNQTYNNLQIIMINDGSTDNSATICNEFSSSDQRFVYIEQRNQGLSAARNAGIDIATGEYITFVDSDDYIQPEMISIMYDVLSKKHTTMVECAYQETTDDNIKPLQTDIKTSIFDGNSKFLRLFAADKSNAIISCGKLYKIDIFDDIRYPIGKYHEDEYVIHRVLGKVDTLAVIDVALYYYRVRKGSITKENFNIKRLDALPALKDRIDYFKNKNLKDLEILAAVDYLKRLPYYWESIGKFYPNERDLQGKVMTEYLDVLAQYKTQMNTSQRMKYNLFAKHPSLYQNIKHVIKVLSGR